MPLHTGATRNGFHKQATFTQRRLHAKAFARSSLYSEAVDHMCFHTQTPLRTQVVLHTECFHHHLHKKALKKKTTFLLKSSKIQFCYNISVCKYKFRPSNLDLRAIWKIIFLAKFFARKFQDRTFLALMPRFGFGAAGSVDRIGVAA
jgi:hypothetical protein